jgi:Na+/H+ antiporter NhaD/arsenite permease-like protein
MNRLKTLALSAVLLAGIGLNIFTVPLRAQAQPSETTPLIVGSVLDRQNSPVTGAAVLLLSPNADEPLAEGETQPDGRFALEAPASLPAALLIRVERAHFTPYEQQISSLNLQQLTAGETLVIPTITLIRQLSPAFWLSTIIFLGMLVLIAAGKLHNTLAALLGTALVFTVSYLGSPINEKLFIFDFENSLRYIDWNVIFLIMGMMIVIAVVENTGLFQWLAFFAYRMSRGRSWLLLIILMTITGVASAFLDNVTTMLLMTPITVQIALAMGMNPLAFLIPEVMASNVIGISTLIGTPTNILIGSYADISFNSFLTNLTPGVVLSFAGLVVYCLVIYRSELGAASSASPLLYEKLAERGTITEPGNLSKAGLIGAGMLLMFVFGEEIHLVPAVTALIGATALLVWIRPNIEEMIEAVDWTTLVFFMSLFIVVGAIQEVGLISFIADGIGRIIGENLVLAIIVITWLSALLSTVVANIPFTAAMLPVIGFLTSTMPGAESKVLFYCLSVGSAMGGNGSLIGASANMITSGIAERAGYPITYAYFIKKGFPALLITVSLATVWLLIRFG